MRRLPGLRSLQAFEAVVRHLSLKDAAEELHVTPTAVSHRIRGLEDQLGIQLFHRRPRMLELTSEAAAIARRIVTAFEVLRSAIAALDEDRLAGTLTVSTTNSLASSWLSPRLRSFRDQHTEIAVRLIATDTITDFHSDDSDLAIRYCVEPPAHLEAAWLLDDYIAPVCAPEMAAQLTSPQDLLQAHLIEYRWHGFSNSDPSWESWLRAHGCTPENALPYVTYSEEHMCLWAAADGHGVALVSLIAAARFINEGKLVLPFDGPLKNKSYYVVNPAETSRRARCRSSATGFSRRLKRPAEWNPGSVHHEWRG
ncbi:LysR substrate-binding domain-containing protein [Salipiger mucosus]|uniref:Glycine cleavage system transcriptional activator n=1 Tax=Salipiger mucosus DSM 16094 TaxID=1123237 RepID=S9Q8P2_9RHOB|nr:LysR substrate-binding domain-containing protein [Salipiger mucosus]EPX76387.1 Glycine cleavage system transcriptional activator [Salipiger mucosus DSM 16094]